MPGEQAIHDFVSGHREGEEVAALTLVELLAA
jgi:hypothetical protein